ncbi:MAG: DUF6463 family protein [Chloroflexota bacterium]|nr:DUF6463 family protein [Chloroflexota bacterium]
MSTLTKWIPRLITGTAIIHLTYGLVVAGGFKSLQGIAGDRFVNTVEGHPERESWFWFMWSGVALLALGEHVRWTVRETGRLPVRLGAWLLALGVPLTVVIPASGGWLVAAVGGLALRAARSEDSRLDAVAVPARSAVHE